MPEKPTDSAAPAPPAEPAAMANPAALTPAQLARALGLSEEAIRQRLAEGAPAGADGSLNLVHFSAWLNRRLKERDGD